MVNRGVWGHPDKYIHTIAGQWNPKIIPRSARLDAPGVLYYITICGMAAEPESQALQTHCLFKSKRELVKDYPNEFFELLRPLR